MIAQSKRIAFFDFDGTLTKSDSLKHFLLFYFNFWELVLKTLQYIPSFISFKFFQRNNAKAKQALFKVFFKGYNDQEFNSKCKEFSIDVVPRLINDKVLQRAQWHQKRGDEVVVVSASIENYLSPFFKAHDIKVIGTKLEVIEGKLSGYFNGNNCNGHEKKVRIENNYKLSEYKKSYAYGNSSGDDEMMNLVDEAFFRYPVKNTTE